jgi:hypothetical protein
MAFMRTWVPPGLFPYLAQGLLEDASLLALMREHGYHPAGGPRQVQAVTADPGLSQKLNTSPRQPLLLLEGVTREALGYGPEWFNVWHAPNTVFDVDAQLTSQPASISQEHLRRLRTLTQQLETELAALDQTARWPPLGQMGPRGDFVGRASRRSCQDALTRAVRAVTLTLWPGTAAAPSPTEPSPDQATLLPNDRPGVAAGAAALRPGDPTGSVTTPSWRRPVRPARPVSRGLPRCMGALARARRDAQARLRNRPSRGAPSLPGRLPPGG